MSAPVKGAVGLEVLGGVPESAIVARVDADGAIVAPAGQAAGLRTAPGNERSLGLHGSDGIGRYSAGIANGGTNRAARCAISHGDIAGLVHRDASHPPGSGIRRK